jgi:hypothetical protein
MRIWLAWTAAALVAAGCGGGTELAASGGARDEHEGGDVVCAECFVTGGGQLLLNGQAVQFQISPQNLQLMVVPASGDGFTIRGDVEGTRDCERENGVLTATVFGTLETGEPFTLAVVDGGEPEDDSLTLGANGLSIVADVDEGNIQVHDLDRCEPPPECPPGECVCPDTGMCEPCHEPPPPPRCDHGMCWCEETQLCEPCDLPPHGHDGAPPPDGGMITPPPDGTTSPPPPDGATPPPGDGTNPPPGDGTTPPPPPGPFIPL